MRIEAQSNNPGCGIWTWNRIDRNGKGKKASQAKFLDPEPKYMAHGSVLQYCCAAITMTAARVIGLSLQYYIAILW